MTGIEVTIINLPPPYKYQIFVKLKVISSLDFTIFQNTQWDRICRLFLIKHTLSFRSSIA